LSITFMKQWKTRKEEYLFKKGLHIHLFFGKGIVLLMVCISGL
jgi:hypothetical protein